MTLFSKLRFLICYVNLPFYSMVVVVTYDDNNLSKEQIIVQVSRKMYNTRDNVNIERHLG